MRLAKRGQVTIPIGIRGELGLMPGTPVEFRSIRDAVEIRKAKSRQTRGRDMVRAMRGRADAGLTTDEMILALTRGE